MVTIQMSLAEEEMRINIDRAPDRCLNASNCECPREYLSFLGRAFGDGLMIQETRCCCCCTAVCIGRPHSRFTIVIFAP